MDDRLAAHNARLAHARERKRTQRGRQLHNHADQKRAKGSQHPCRRCGSTYNVQCHHIVHRARLGTTHPELHHIDNGMPLCHDCHQAHHTTVEGRIPRSLLTTAERAFLLEHAAGWADSWYPEP